MPGKWQQTYLLCHLNEPFAEIYPDGGVEAPGQLKGRTSHCAPNVQRASGALNLGAVLLVGSR